MDIADKVKSIIAEQLDVDPAQIKDSSQFIEDLGADSLAFVELALKLEQTFGLDIPDEDTEKLRTVGAAIEYIKSRVQK